MMARKRNKSTLRFSLLLLGCMLAHTASVHAQSPTQHYPPYPGIWQWVIPQAYEHDSIVNLYALPTGEYVISSTWWEPVDRPRAERTMHSACRTLFAQGQTTEEACRALERSGRWVKPTEKIQFRDGTTIERGGSIHPYCYGGLSPTLVIKNPQREVIAEKVLLVIRDTPRRYEASSRCADGGEDFDEKVVALFANFVLLADETFLLFDGTTFGYGPDKEFGFLLRFDKQLHIQATLLGQKMFLIDSATLNNIEVQGGYSNYQEIDEILLTYLSKLQRKE